MLFPHEKDRSHRDLAKTERRMQRIATAVVTYREFLVGRNAALEELLFAATCLENKDEVGLLTYLKRARKALYPFWRVSKTSTVVGFVNVVNDPVPR